MLEPARFSCCDTASSLTSPITLIGLWETLDARRVGFSMSGARLRTISGGLRRPAPADRFRSMATDLLAKAEDFEDLRALRFRREKLAAA